MMPSWIEVATSSLKQKKDIHEKWMNALKDTRRPKVMPLFLLSLKGKFHKQEKWSRKRVLKSLFA